LTRVVGYMRIETKSRCQGPEVGLSRSGVTGVLPLVEPDECRRRQDFFLDRDCPQISLLKFEPFASTMRPNGLKTENEGQRQECSKRGSSLGHNEITWVSGDRSERPKRWVWNANRVFLTLPSN